MKYILITKNGKVMCFFIKAVAEMYQVIEGGVLCVEEIDEIKETV